MPKNIYIHIPFCSSKCSYCNFSTIISEEKNIYEKYVDCLVYEIENFLGNEKIQNLNSIYFGGGTPSIIEPKLIGKIINKFKIGISKKTEILIECNPQNISEKNLKGWKKVGVTKISIGIQTFQSKFFDFIERKITNLPEKILLAKKYFPNLSIDLIFGYPEQILEDLKKDLLEIQKLKIEHISFYALDYKPNSKIEKLKGKAISIDKICKFYAFICENLKKQGFEHYETYNFAKNGNFGVHNMDFWNGEDYLGFGLSAVGTIGNKIFENTKNLKKYCFDFLPASAGVTKRNAGATRKIDTINDFDKNYLLLERGFRLISGIEEKKLKKLVDNHVFEKMKNSHFITEKKGEIALKESKMMFFNDFFEEIFS